MVGNDRARGTLRAWATAWRDAGRTPPGRRAAVLEGPPGVGKTTAALALASEFGWTVVELNASDARNQRAIESVAGRASLTHTLTAAPAPAGGSRTLILLDEADCLTGRSTDEGARPRPTATLRDFLRTRYGPVEELNQAWGLIATGRHPPFAGWDEVPVSPGRFGWARLPGAQRDIGDWREGERPHDTSDRGGLAAIARLVRETLQPLVLTVNDPSVLTRYSAVFRTGVIRVPFDRVPPTVVRTLLRRIAVDEGYTIPSLILDRILDRSGGDLRAALNDLEAIAPLGSASAMDSLLGGRDHDAEVAEVIEGILRRPRFVRSSEISNQLDVTPDDLFPWFEEAVARARVGPATRVDAWAELEVADRFLNWARRWRVWSLWSYASEIQSGGVSVALDGGDAPVGAFPSFLGAMGRTRQRRAIRMSLLTKTGHAWHLSRRKGVESVLPWLEALAGSAPGRGGPSLDEVLGPIVRGLDLTPEELGYLLRIEPDDPRVHRLLVPVEPAPEPKPEPWPEPPAAEPAPGRGKGRGQRKLGEY